MSRCNSFVMYLDFSSNLCALCPDFVLLRTIFSFLSLIFVTCELKLADISSFCVKLIGYMVA